MHEERRPQQDQQPRQSVEVLAYELWELRGRPWGTPELDWFMAEGEINAAHEDIEHEPPTVAAAKMVGSVLGSVAGLVTTFAHSFDSE